MRIDKKLNSTAILLRSLAAVISLVFSTGAQIDAGASLFFSDWYRLNPDIKQVSLFLSHPVIPGRLDMAIKMGLDPFKINKKSTYNYSISGDEDFDIISFFPDTSIVDTQSIETFTTNYVFNAYQLSYPMDLHLGPVLLRVEPTTRFTTFKDRTKSRKIWYNIEYESNRLLPTYTAIDSTDYKYENETHSYVTFQMRYGVGYTWKSYSILLEMMSYGTVYFLGFTIEGKLRMWHNKPGNAN